MSEETEHLLSSSIHDITTLSLPTVVTTSTRQIPVTECTATEFGDLIQSVERAINEGQLPILIGKGSSGVDINTGSYFCKDETGNVIGVFKPKDEEPYGRMNPKWIKWLHRSFLPCCFGRSCIIV
jgi:Phosphatidylinositol 3- and 4-kinase